MRPEMQERVRACEERLDIEFQNPLLLLEALTHRSYLNEDPSHPTGHNERLEFLGDAVVGLVVTEFLFKKFSADSEGKMTRYRGSLVSGQVMGGIIEELGFHRFMLFAKGQRTEMALETAYARKATSIICGNLFEAIVGAIYLDQGIGACRLFLDHFLLRRLKELGSGESTGKEAFQEEIQARFGLTPAYRKLHKEGSDHDARWTVGCFLGAVRVSEGMGSSKREAETAAANLARETITQWEGRIAEAGKLGSAMRHSEKGRGQ